MPTTRSQVIFSSFVLSLAAAACGNGAEGSGSNGGAGGFGAISGGAGGSGAAGGTSGAAGGTGGGVTGTWNGSCTNSRFIQLIDNEIHDISGARIVARGPEMVVASTSNTTGVDTAAATGANAARFLLTLDAANGMTPAGFDTVIRQAITHNMILWLSLYTWNKDKNNVIGDALGGGNFYSLTAPAGTGTCSTSTPVPCYLAVWARPWLKDLVAKYQGHVILDAMQEYIGVAAAETEAGRAEWATAAETNIIWFRGAGYSEPLEIMANFQGRDLYSIVQKGSAIRAVDSVVVSGNPQTMFGWQAYWENTWYKTWQGGLLSGVTGTSITAAQAIHKYAVTRPFPIQIGFDNYPDDTGGEYTDQMAQSATDNASWLWWSWNYGSNNVDCPVDGATCQSRVTTSQDGYAGAERSTCGL